MSANQETGASRYRVASAWVVLQAVLVALVAGCGGRALAAGPGPDASSESFGAGTSDVPDASSAGAVGNIGGPTSAPACPAGSPLDCYVNTHCLNGGTTSLSGTVYDPAGRNPLPNVVVFVPSDPALLPTIAQGTSVCVTCNTSIGDYVNFSFTDSAGHFKLTSVPTGGNVPLVMQIGKWRRLITVPRTLDCADTAVDPKTTRLPRNHTEGDLPQMAVLTGGCDNIACFLQNVGVDPSEFAAPHTGGRVDVYQGLGATGAGAALSGGVAGDCTTAACPLWSSKQNLEAYDEVFLGCECDEHNETKPPASLQALHDWLGEGGDVFATHSQATWFKNGPADFMSVADWTSGPASGAAGPFMTASTSQGGMSFEAWLANVGAADDGGVVALDPAAVSTSVTAVAPGTTAWIDDSSTATDGGPRSGNVKTLSVGTPITRPDASYEYTSCGQINFTDIHPGGGQALQAAGSDGSTSPAAVPAVCGNGPLSAGDEVLEYLLFNKSACVQTEVPRPPPPPPPTG